MRETGASDADRCDRRTVLEAALGVGVGVAALPVAAAVAAEDPKSARPQAGDQFVFQSGDKKGTVIKVEDLSVGGPQVLAYPLDPQSNTQRSGSRLNQVVLIRLDPAQLTEETRAGSAEGVVAYSAVCTHQGCPVHMWKKEVGHLFCSCHGTEYDPKDGAKVVSGPAPRRLATLPVKVQDGIVVAAGEFSGRVGFK